MAEAGWGGIAVVVLEVAVCTGEVSEPAPKPAPSDPVSEAQGPAVLQECTPPLPHPAPPTVRAGAFCLLPLSCLSQCPAPPLDYSCPKSPKSRAGSGTWC